MRVVRNKRIVRTKEGIDGRSPPLAEGQCLGRQQAVAKINREFCSIS